MCPVHPNALILVGVECGWCREAKEAEEHRLQKEKEKKEARNKK